MSTAVFDEIADLVREVVGEDFLLEQHFRHMIEKGMLGAGGVRKIGIVGPGLDFANKDQGTDFYPPQTTQPFAVLDSLFRLGVANPARNFMVISGGELDRDGGRAGEPQSHS